MKSPEFFYKEVSKELGIDLDIVTAANKYFWKQGVEQEITKGEHISIYIGELGTIYAGLTSLRKLIVIHIHRLKVLRKKNPTPKTLNDVKLLKARLETLFKLRKKLIKEKQKIKNERAARVSEANTHSNK